MEVQPPAASSLFSFAPGSQITIPANSNSGSFSIQRSSQFGFSISVTVTAMLGASSQSASVMFT
jgi:hypothetical protein